MNQPFFLKKLDNSLFALFPLPKIINLFRPRHFRSIMIILAIVNDGSANDIYLEVSKLIIAKGKTPEYTDY
jgi:hypothetical protein